MIAIRRTSVLIIITSAFKKNKKSFDVRNPPDVDGDPVDVSVASLGSILWRNFFFAHALFVFSLFPIQ